MTELNFKDYLLACESALPSLTNYRTDLGLPSRVEPGRVVKRVEDRPKYKLVFEDGGYVEFDRQDWFRVARGKRNFHNIRPGDKVDVEYYAHESDTSRTAKKVMSVMVY